LRLNSPGLLIKSKLENWMRKSNKKFYLNLQLHALSIYLRISL
jgi:hypothetical protein